MLLLVCGDDSSHMILGETVPMGLDSECPDLKSQPSVLPLLYIHTHTWKFTRTVMSIVGIKKQKLAAGVNAFIFSEFKTLVHISNPQTGMGGVWSLHWCPESRSLSCFHPFVWVDVGHSSYAAVAPSAKKPHNNWHLLHKDNMRNEIIMVIRCFELSRGKWSENTGPLPSWGSVFCSWMQLNDELSCPHTFVPLKGIPPLRNSNPRVANRATAARARPPSAREMWARQRGQRCLEQACLRYKFTKGHIMIPDNNIGLAQTLKFKWGVFFFIVYGRYIVGAY